MAPSSAPRSTIYNSCTPLRCPNTPTFDLEDMLRASIALEDDSLDTVDSETSNPTPSTPQGMANPGLQGLSYPGEPGRSIDCTCVPDAPSTPKPSSSHTPGPSATLEATTRASSNYQHRYRKRKRDAEIRQVGHVPTPKTTSTLVPLALEAATPVRLDYIDLPANDGAYSAMIRKKKKRKTAENARENSTESPVKPLQDRVYTLEEIQALGLRVYPWDGITPVPFVDSEGRIFMVLAGRPLDKPGQKKPYSQACQDVYMLLEKLGQEAQFPPENLSHRRGDYPVLNVGVTHGMGTVGPTYLDLRPNTAAIERVLESSDVQRIAAYGSASYGLWFPKNHGYYKKNLDILFEHTGLRRIFPKSIFPSAALNCGPGVCTKPHTDGQNCPFGVCTVTSLGRFNPKTGGHLVLWELGLAVEFPPGSTILLPSATITHSNTPVLEGEARASFTQYASGGLFRWVDYGFQTEKNLKKRNPTLYKEIMQVRPNRWKIGVGLYSTLAELRSQLS